MPADFTEHENPARMVVLIIVTCGIYSLYLLYKWIRAINATEPKPLFHPGLAIFLTLITGGIASIYFQYEIVKRIVEISKRDPPNGVERDPSMKPPMNNLKEIVLYGNIAAFAASIFSSGILTVFAFVYFLWLTCAIQSGLEYAFATPQD